MDKVAVVILNWNGQEMMRRFLPGVVAHTRAVVYVADNGSTDSSMKMLAEEFPEVRTVELGQNYGFAEGYNKALAQIEAEYFVLLNSDVEVRGDWVTPLLEHLKAHPETAACQPKILSWHSPGQFEYAGAAGGFIDALGYPYCRGRIFGEVEKDEGQYDETCPVFWATGAALMVRAAVYHACGGLDARFFAHMEEIDFCWRLRSRGYGIACVPESVVYHVGGGTLDRENPRKNYLNFRNNLYMLYKNLPEERLGAVMRWRYWLDRLAALQFLLTGQFKSCRAVFKAWADFRHIRKELLADRKTNLSLAVISPVPEQSRISILWAYYVLRRRQYSQISHK